MWSLPTSFEFQRKTNIFFFSRQMSVLLVVVGLNRSPWSICACRWLRTQTPRNTTLIAVFSLFFGAVVDGLLELLAQRGGAHDKGSTLTLARLPGSIYLRLSRGDSWDRAIGEVDILANKEKCIEAFNRVHDCEWFRNCVGSAKWDCDISCSFTEAPKSTCY